MFPMRSKLSTVVHSTGVLCNTHKRMLDQDDNVATDGVQHFCVKNFLKFLQSDPLPDAQNLALWSTKTRDEPGSHSTTHLCQSAGFRLRLSGKSWNLGQTRICS